MIGEVLLVVIRAQLRVSEHGKEILFGLLSIGRLLKKAAHHANIQPILKSTVITKFWHSANDRDERPAILYSTMANVPQ
ncbi:MAG: hypothetical protein IPI00_13265 [Flavobacteriales bacterium]|nr:hypothetical protein [Flavobacteriales bacterium]MBK6944749.1 hypothetical protein [Flavobacteriales bacterium]MBK7241104.1 hypothetical protein [Flavobacteriales bacterium]MBK9534404.1 hypothetical protein [Flavobacteriales bacterium]MBP9137172.1 hypothetical protein [Flavobacteriales bacterium]